ncbi:carbonic anhydrase [Methylobacterium radiotolerans]|uniref:Carbonic anhydrase n=1 Tax=Methylobacterium radiotolerans (strain ATCC 27329 / DSM 1819 / JCM 2831 / NBRC 15690 / NCIMB 10815 / 0-1) TaxID=426355 RepID=B1M967_METRJ|nr:carbonic anhydrase [Methylobacterium radiotolerans]ACB28042.1 carbonic anhydrase [Methylobacterium radiotolerans JCM 2831]GEN01794.1 carbonic anhydrase [Methylobacterium radiotolerans]
MDADCDCCTEIGAPRFGRRHLLLRTTGLLAASVLPGGVVQAASLRAKTSLSPADALGLMKAGNENFRNEATALAVNGRQRRLELARGQAPFCVLVGCSDSRVSPEILFGRGLGELFIVRNAGNTVDISALGSIEYAVGVLGVPLVVVLGHESCGAVAAAIDVVEKNASFPGVIGEMVQPIVPAVLEARGQGGDLLEASVRTNARRVAKRLTSQSPVIKDALTAGKVKVVSAHYGLADGHVEWMQEI